MPSKQQPLSIRSLSGRNPTDPPHALPEDMAQEVQNVDFFQATLGRRRPGSSSDTLAFPGITFQGGLRFLKSHMPDENPANRELWASDNANTSGMTLARHAGATATSVVLKDAIKAFNAGSMRGVSFNGKFFLAYTSTNTALDRLHVWDPGDTEVRRVGLGTPGAHSDTSVGAASPGVDFERFYRVAWVEMTNGDTDGTVERRSELSTAVAFTPNTSSTGARITQPTAPGEKETHWELYADTANTSGVFYRVARTVVDSNTATTYDDGAASIADYNTLTISDDTGINTPPKAARYIVADESRLLMGGSFLASGKKSRIEFTPVIGDRDIGDDERIVLSGTQKNIIDIGEGDGGGLTGIAGPVWGAFYAFKRDQVWKLIPTGVLANPYRPVNISRSRGCVDDLSIALAEDHVGNEALYFMSEKGPYRIGARGLEYIGHSVEDLRPNPAAITGGLNRPTVSLYLPDLKQVWMWVATATATDPNKLLVFDIQKGVPDQDGVVRRGWSVYTGDLARALGATLMANTLGASMSPDLKPYVSIPGLVLLKGNDTSLNQDNTVGYQGLIKTRALSLGGLSKEFGLGQGYLLAKKEDTATKIDMSVSRDFARETRVFTADLSGDTEATRVTKLFEVDLSDATFVEVTIADTASAVNVDWQLDAMEILASDDGVK